MGVRNASTATTTLIVATVVPGAETLICTTGLIGLVQDNAQVFLSWMLKLTGGSTSALQSLRVRRGAALTDALVGVSFNLTTIATNLVQISGCYPDMPGVVGSVQYSLTLQPQAGGTNTTIQDASLMAFVL